MSRIRTIKPEFWTSEQVLACSPVARLLFIGMWNFCDDNGVHAASHIRLKAEIFPGGDCTETEIKNFINELINNALIREYVVEDKAYWIVTGWKNHQKIDKPTFRHPLPQSDLKKVADNSTNIRRELSDLSPITPRMVNELSNTESNGMESKGKEIYLCEVETSPVSTSDPNLLAACKDIFIYWQQKLNHPEAKLDNKRQRKIMQALKLGYSVDDLKQAIDGCASTAFNMGDNDRKQVYDDICLIFRDAERIERFINNYKINQSQINDSMRGVL